MPVAGVMGGERPFNCGPIQPLVHVLIVQDIIRIVVVDEIVLQRRPIGDGCDQYKTDGEPQDPILSAVKLHER